MNITANTPRPKPAKNQRPGCISWLFLLIILLGPLRGILQAIIGPRLGNIPLAPILTGIVILAAAGSMLARAAAGRSTGPRLPTSPTVPGQPFSPPASSPSTMTRLPTPAMPNYQGGAPRFEPVITAKVFLAGVVLAAVLAGGLFLVWLSLGATP